jgi:hypothetical protein
MHYDRFPPSVSPQSNPIEWISLNRKHVATIARLSLGQEAIATACESSKVYPVCLFSAYLRYHNLNAGSVALITVYARVCHRRFPDS